VIPRGQGGQATVLVLGMSLVVFGVVGVATDGTRAFLARRTLQSAADSAAQAGASELDAARYYASRGRVIRLEPQEAERMARHLLGLRGIEARALISIERGAVRVVLRSEVPTTFLRLIGVSTVPVAVEAASAPVAVP
jgi:Putative Flp pilus-assembly TadE/G-like